MIMDLTYEEFEDLVREYYHRHGHQGIQEVWGCLCDDHDIESDEIFDKWFDEIYEDLENEN